jgi:energy-converting hydrogenase B subunit Q
MLHPARRGVVMTSNELALLIAITDRPGVLHELTGVISRHAANIGYIDITDRSEGRATVYFELEDVPEPDHLIADLKAVPNVSDTIQVDPFARVYGKRVIVIGGGAQVGQVAVGAVSEADRHNIRGERISVDTIPLVGESELATPAPSARARPRGINHGR